MGWDSHPIAGLIWLDDHIEESGDSNHEMLPSSPEVGGGGKRRMLQNLATAGDLIPFDLLTWCQVNQHSRSLRCLDGIWPRGQREENYAFTARSGSRRSDYYCPVTLLLKKIMRVVHTNADQVASNEILGGQIGKK